VGVDATPPAQQDILLDEPPETGPLSQPQPVIHESRHDLAHALVAAEKRRRVMVVADPPVVQHVLQVADHSCASQLRPAGWDQRLVHVQGDRERTHDPLEGVARGGKNRFPPPGNRRLHPGFVAADVRQALDLLR
jgi:hypothetical protein